MISVGLNENTNDPKHTIQITNPADVRFVAAKNKNILDEQNFEPPTCMTAPNKPE